ncbi:hypothetical protein CLAIMM_01278 isoform 1 [Cladophialophora immunda]|nr:hypothetical protein CLAIMM_01278 isoform 1 [Cladophialophora immunda]
MNINRDDTMMAVQEFFGRFVTSVENLRPLSYTPPNVGFFCIAAATLIALLLRSLLRKRDFATFDEHVGSPPSMESQIRAGFKKFKQPFMIKMNIGPMLMLQTEHIDEIKNTQAFSFADFFGRIFFSSYPGFEAFGRFVEDNVFSNVVRVKLTQALAMFTEDLSQETAFSLPAVFPQSGEWTESNLYPDCLALVTRLSSLVFVGREFDRLDDWHRVSNLYGYHSTEAARTLRQWHPLLRPIVHWFLPETTFIRKLLKEAREIIEPEVEKRKIDRQKRLAEGKQPRKSLDTVDWFVECAEGRPFDITVGELTLAGVAIHTTTFTLVNVLLDICTHPDVIEPLRKEIKDVLAEDGGLGRQSLHKLKLMDSLLKESQRVNSISSVGMGRMTTDLVKLHNGKKIQKGTLVGVAPLPMYDPVIFDHPEQFDAFRFATKRQKASQENKWQFTTTSPEHIGFGHGLHACPGRFFAGNELKIALVHLLLKYDWKLPAGETRPGLVDPPGEFFRVLGGQPRLLFKSVATDVNF